jgi:exodeoxyribonuclease-3
VRQRYDLKEKVVVCGDFNVTFDDRDVHDPKLWHEKILCSTPERERLNALIELGLTDSFRKFHEDGGHYTWWDFRTRGFQRGQGLRIDHILMSSAALSTCSDVWIDKGARDGEKPSDHAPVLARLDS